MIPAHNRHLFTVSFSYTRGADIAPLLFLLVELIATFGTLDFVQFVVAPRVAVIVTH
jgi:hypothetical protein